jgi:hypothetical protein
MSMRTTNRQQKASTNNVKPREADSVNFIPASASVSTEERIPLIQVRAYALWENAGKPHDEASRHRFWHEAEKEIAASHTTAK